MKKPHRVRVYIDGENFIISTKLAIKASGDDLHTKINWRTLASTYLRPQRNEALDQVTFFTALHKHNKPIHKSQIGYFKQLKDAGVYLVFGQFKQKQFTCRECRKIYWGHEEKETDINIALQVVCDAEDDLYKRAIIVSADTDLTSAVRCVKQRHPEKEISVVTPPKRADRKRSAHEFLKCADNVQEMPLRRIKSYLFHK